MYLINSMQTNNHLKNPKSNDNFFISAPLNKVTDNFFDTPFEQHNQIEEPKFTPLADKKKANVRISYNNLKEDRNFPSMTMNSEIIDESLKSNLNVKHELFVDKSPKRLSVMRDRRDKSFTRPSIQIFKETQNRSASNRSQKFTNTAIDTVSNNNNNCNQKMDNSQNERLSNRSKSFEANDNFSIVSKNSKSPLNVLVLDGSKKTRSHGSYHSKGSYQETDDLTNDPIMLKTLLTARNAEIRHLNQKLDELQEMRESREIMDYDDPQQRHMSSYKIKRLEEELNSLKKENQSIKAENANLSHQLQKSKNELNQQMFNMKLKFEENARKNMEVMEREVAFKYASDENESIKYMKERIETLEATLKTYQQTNN